MMHTVRVVLVVIAIGLAACDDDGTAPSITGEFRLVADDIVYEANDTWSEGFYRERWLRSTFNSITLKLDTPGRGNVQLVGNLRGSLMVCDLRGSPPPGPQDCVGQEHEVAVEQAQWFWLFSDVQYQGTYSWRGDTLFVDFGPDGPWLLSSGIGVVVAGDSRTTVWRRSGTGLAVTTDYDGIGSTIALRAPWAAVP